jgi:ribosomal protein L32
VAVGKHYSKICPSCVREKFTKCSICGELHLKDKVKNGICQVCAITSPNVIACQTCGEYHVLSKFKGAKVTLEHNKVLYFCNDTCVEPYIVFMKEMRRWGGMKKSTCCNSYFHESLLEVRANGQHKITMDGKNIKVETGEYFVCPTHVQIDTSKQIEFKFPAYRKKKEKADDAALAS